MALIRITLVVSRAAIVAAAALLVLAGCSSGTEPGSARDGIDVSLAVSASQALVGDTVTATMTITNTTSESIVRTYSTIVRRPYIQPAFNPLVLYFLDNGFGDFVDVSQSATFSMAPHESKSYTVQLRAIEAGETRVTGCLPATTDGDAICASRVVAVRAR